MVYRLKGSVSDVSRLMLDFEISKPLQAFSAPHETLDVLVSVEDDASEDFEISALEMDVVATEEGE